MSTFGDQLYQYGGVPVNGSFTTGSVYFVKPYTGSNSDSGKTPDHAIKTVYEAHSRANADKMDIAYLVSESQSMAYTTDWLSATLAISKDGFRLLGVNSGNIISPRSRIGILTGSTGLAPMITWSADNGVMANILVAAEIDDATSLGAVNVTGECNYFYRNHFAGCLHNTMDATGQYSLRVSGSENLFEECTIGADTIGRGTAANCELLLAGAGTRNIFRRCLFLTFAEANTHQFVTRDSSGTDRFTLFEDCTFINPIRSTATTMLEAFDVTDGGSPNGLILLRNCTFVGVTDIEAGSPTETVYIDGAAPTNNTSGLAVVVEAT